MALVIGKGMGGVGEKEKEQRAKQRKKAISSAATILFYFFFNYGKFFKFCDVFYMDTDRLTRSKKIDILES